MTFFHNCALPRAMNPGKRLLATSCRQHLNGTSIRFHAFVDNRPRDLQFVPMKLFGHRIGFSQLVVLAILAGGIGGIISGAWPRTGIIMTIFGVIGGLWDHISSDMRNKEIDNFFEAQAILFAKSGIGNIFTKSAKLALEKGGITRALEQFQKALTIDPNDTEALSSLGIMAALELSFEQWFKKGRGSRFHAKLAAAKAYAERGKSLAPNDHIFYDILGIIYDVEGDHEKARNEYRKSGRLRSDPYWHLLMATSWSMSHDEEQGLAEVRQAIKKGGNYWLVDFYHGRALHRIGQFEMALPELKKALQARKWQAEVLREFQDFYYDQGRFGEAAKYAMLCGFAVLRRYPISSIRHFVYVVHHILLELVFDLSKQLWRITRHVPLLRPLHVWVCSPAQPEQSLGFRLIEHKKYNMAEKHLRKACDALPDSPYLWANLCCALIFQGKRADAIEACGMAIRCAGNEQMLAQLKQQKKDLESAAYAGPKRIVKIGR